MSRTHPKIATILMLLGAMLAVACDDGPPPPYVDPCSQVTFDQTLCQAAIARHGYYWYGAWHPMMYPYPYSYYYGGYHTYVIHGGTVSRPSSGVYSRSYSGPRSSFSGGSGTVRGMGGSIGAARSSGGFGS